MRTVCTVVVNRLVCIYSKGSWVRSLDSAHCYWSTCASPCFTSHQSRLPIQTLCMAPRPDRHQDIGPGIRQLDAEQANRDAWAHACARCIITTRSEHVGTWRQHAHIVRHRINSSSCSPWWASSTFTRGRLPKLSEHPDYCVVCIYAFGGGVCTPLAGGLTRMAACRCC